MGDVQEVDIISYQARSKEGGDSDKWITIQKNTFTNWVNIQIGGTGYSVSNLQKDFCDGVRLCSLVSALQNKQIGRVTQEPVNEFQKLANITLALKAIKADNVQLVNIGSEDIVKGSLKLILGLIWHLILRYQIDKSKLPAKKLMLAWLKAVVPDCQISNFTSDWNDGVNLHAVIDYCQPGLCPNWRQLSRSNKLENCRDAMMLAKEKLDIPLVVRPEDLSSPDLDDRSGMTYLSYFMNIDSPGYHATLRNVNALMTEGHIKDFTSSWNDGSQLINLVKSLGLKPGVVTTDHVDNLKRGIASGRRLGVEPILTAKEIAEAHKEHMGIMAYAAYFTRFKPVKSLADKATIDGNFQNVYVGQEKTFRLTIDDDVSAGDFQAEVIGPDSIPPVRLNWSGRTATGSFTPSEMGQHRLNVYCRKEPVNSCPKAFEVSSDKHPVGVINITELKLNVYCNIVNAKIEHLDNCLIPSSSDRPKVTFKPVDKCSVGLITELKVETSSAGQGDMRMEVETPSGKVMSLPVAYRSGVYTANFTPAEVGDHRVTAQYDNEHISGSPFTVKAYDPSMVKVFGLEGGSIGRALTFTADSKMAGDGDLSCTVTYAGQAIPSYITAQNNNVHNVDFTPQGAGVYKVNMYYNNVEIRGSPYTLEIVDSSMVSVSGDGLSLVPANKTATFNVQTRGAGGGNISINITSPNGEQIQANLVRQSDGDYRVEWIPSMVGRHSVDVLFSGQQIAGSPFFINVFDINKIRVDNFFNGSVGDTAGFNVDCSQAGTADQVVRVVSPSGRNVPVDIQEHRANEYGVSYVPKEVGRHKIHLTYGSMEHPGSPYTLEIVDSSMVSVSGDGLSLVPVNKTATFNVQTRGAGGGNISINITSPNGEQIQANLVRQSDGDYRVEWIPSMVGRHSVDVLSSGQQIAGSPFFINVFDINKIRVDNFYNGSVGDTAGFNVDCSQAGKADQVVRVVSPSGRNVPVDIQEHRANEYAVSYVPQEVGRHKIHPTYGSMEHPGSPFTQEIGEGALPTAHGDGLYRGEEDKAATFYVDASGMIGEPDILVDGPNSIAKCSIHPQPGGRYAVTYVPVETGMFDITVQWNGREIHGSPFHPKIVDARKVRVIGGWQHYMDSQERIHLNVGEEKRIPFETADAGPGKLTAEVRGPSGAIVPCTVDDGVIGKNTVIFTPREEGNHFIHLNWSDHPLSSSPFTGYAVGGHQDITKIILSGRGLKKATVREEAEFFIDGSRTGRGEPEVQLTGVRAEVNVVTTPLGGGKFRCTYIPVIPGAYLLHITWNGRQVKGAPFKVNVIMAFYPNKVVVSGEGLKGGLMGHDLDIRIDTRKAEPGELTAFCSGPNKDAYCDLEDNRDGTFRLTIRPTEPGRHVLQVKYGGEHVLGSPFHPKIVDARKVRVIGGWQHYMDSQERIHLNVGEEKRIPFETADAGPGKLTAEVRGPSGAIVPCTVDDGVIGKSTVIFTPRKEGNHFIHLNWSDHPLSSSPFTGYAVGGHQDITKIILSGRGLKKATVREEAEFFIDGSRAGRGEPEVQLTGVRAEVNVVATPLGGGKYRCTYIPVIPGAYLLHITWNGRQLKGAPFKVNVIVAFYPNKVVVSGEGLKGGLMGHYLYIRIDTRKAGPGELTAFCSGPNKDAYCDLEDNRDGTFRLIIRPKEPGRHGLQVKYGGEHVLGSPFVFKVSAKPDAGRVRVSWPGVEHGILATFQSRFIVETHGAGAGHLRVQIRGPKGAFQAEIYRDSQKDKTFRCRFHPTESGLYIIHIFWSNVLVPGGPFHVHIDETQLYRRNRLKNLYRLK